MAYNFHVQQTDDRFITDGFHCQVALQLLNPIVDSLCFHEPLVKNAAFMVLLLINKENFRRDLGRVPDVTFGTRSVLPKARFRRTVKSRRRWPDGTPKEGAKMLKKSRTAPLCWQE
jgi:hypothetical protein